MNKDCHCFSCTKYRYWEKIQFLKKSQLPKMENLAITTSSDIGHHSTSQIDRLPDEVLIRILSFISPSNIKNFITLIALEMVSKRIRHCAIDKKIWKNVTELVMGFYPDLPEDRYLCHIGHFSMELFLRRVPKITKVIVNNDSWLCYEMMEKQIMPLIDRFAGKFQTKQLIVYDLSNEFDRDVYFSVYFGPFACRDLDGPVYGVVGPVSIKLVDCSKQFLETYQYYSFHASFNNSNHTDIARGLGKCVNLKNVKISVSIFPYNFDCFLHILKNVESLEFGSYTLGSSAINYIIKAISSFPVGSSLPFQLQTLRFTNPRDHTHTPQFQNLAYLKRMLSTHNAPCIQELEIDLCSHWDDLTYLPHFLDNVSYLNHFKVTFLPCFKFNKTHIVVEFLQNNFHMKKDDMKISVTFKHSDIDGEVKLSIIHRLLDEFDVPHLTEQEGIWEFIRGKLHVILKLEKFDDSSLFCHRHPPPVPQQ